MNTEKLKIKFTLILLFFGKNCACVHKKLFDLTNEEYIELLSGQVDKLSDIIDENQNRKKKSKLILTDLKF